MLLRSVTRSSSNASTSLFFRLFPRSYFSRSSPATGRNIRRLSAAGTGSELFLRRGLRLLPAAASGCLSGQFSLAVSTQTATSYPGRIIEL